MKSGTKIELALDFGLRYWYGKMDLEGKVSVFRDQLLMTYDARYNDFDVGLMPKLNILSLVFERFSSMGYKPWLYGTLKDKSGVKNQCM